MQSLCAPLSGCAQSASTAQSSLPVLFDALLSLPGAYGLERAELGKSAFCGLVFGLGSSSLGALVSTLGASLASGSGSGAGFGTRAVTGRATRRGAVRSTDRLCRSTTSGALAGAAGCQRGDVALRRRAGEGLVCAGGGQRERMVMRAQAANEVRATARSRDAHEQRQARRDPARAITEPIPRAIHHGRVDRSITSERRQWSWNGRGPRRGQG